MSNIIHSGPYDASLRLAVRVPYTPMGLNPTTFTASSRPSYAAIYELEGLTWDDYTGSWDSQTQSWDATV